MSLSRLSLKGEKCLNIRTALLMHNLGLSLHVSYAFLSKTVTRKRLLLPKQLAS